MEFQTTWQQGENGVSTTLQITCDKDGTVELSTGGCPEHNDSSKTFPNTDEALRHISGLMHEGQDALK